VLVFDIEADGLLDTIENVHCLVAKNVETGEITKLYNDLLTSDNIISLFDGSDKIIGHNIISYDLPLIKMMYGLNIVDILGKDAIIDTYLWSKVLNPDREMPRGCPTSIKNPVTNKLKKIGPHGLESWGWRVGEKKIEIHDWRYFDEKMLERCEVDVSINERVYNYLLKEANL
jgi:hypothetical protein